MESPAKKILLTNESGTDDPFWCLHEHVHEMIHQHMNGRDVLNAFEVSPAWNELAATSRRAMSQIKLRFFEKTKSDPSPDEITALLKSDRVYQNISAQFRFSRNTARKIKLLHRFSPTLVDLEVDCFEDVLVTSFPANISFPKLKSLKVNNSPEINLKLLHATSEVTKLSINMKMNDELVQCIKSQEKLKDLELRGDRNEFFSLHSLQEAEFTLNSLKITNQEKELEETVSRNNFNVFLKTSGTAVSVTINRCVAEDINVFINQLPRLKTLQIHSIYGSLQTLELKLNRSISEFKFGMIFTAAPIPRTVLTSLTKLETLKVFDLSQDDFEWIVKTLKLKKLAFHRWIPHAELPSITFNMCYDQLKISEPTANQNIEIEKVDKI